MALSARTGRRNMGFQLAEGMSEKQSNLCQRSLSKWMNDLTHFDDTRFAFPTLRDLTWCPIAHEVL